MLSNLANRILGVSQLGARSPVHPNDHVNKSQSSNDAFPTAMHLAAAKQLQHCLLPAVRSLRLELHTKATEFRDLVKSGRTHMQDATPLTLGQEFSAFAQQMEHCEARLIGCQPRLHQLAIGW